MIHSSFSLLSIDKKNTKLKMEITLDGFVEEQEQMSVKKGQTKFSRTTILVFNGLLLV
jgi:hypothetical protein